MQSSGSLCYGVPENVMTGGRKTYRCPDCKGCGQCENCYGSGTNLHFNDSDPTCRTCRGVRYCQTCAGNGFLRKLGRLDIPVGLRVTFSAIPLFMLYKVVVANEPVHLGRGGPIMSKADGWLSVICVCLPLLYLAWKGVKLSDFDFRRDRRSSILDHSTASPGQQHSTGERRP